MGVTSYIYMGSYFTEDFRDPRILGIFLGLSEKLMLRVRENMGVCVHMHAHLHAWRVKECPRMELQQKVKLVSNTSRRRQLKGP